MPQFSNLDAQAHDFCSYFGALQGTMVTRLTLEFLRSTSISA